MLQKWNESPTASHGAFTDWTNALTRKAESHRPQENLQPKRSFGQHFLRHASDAERISALLGEWDKRSLPEVAFLEIGPGEGALTRAVLRAFPMRRLVAVEIERDAVARLEASFAQEPRVKIEATDILTYTPTEEQVAVVGNLPYNISAPIIEWTVAHRDKIDYAVFMLQKEVAFRLAGRPGSKDWAPLSIMTQLYYDITVRFTLPPASFDPPPAVDSTVVSLARRDLLTEALPANFERIVRASFTQRRKLLRWNLHTALGIPNDALARVFESVGFGSHIRAEEVSIEKFVDLCHELGRTAPSS